MLYNKTVFFITLFFSVSFYAQTGPGGIGDNTSNVLWVKAEDITTVVDGSDVTTWDDFSGNANNLNQPDASFKPVYKSNILNGKPVVRFNKANGRLVKTNFTDFPTNEITAIYVNNNAGESYDGILSYASTAHDNDFLIFNSNNIAPHRVSSYSSGVDVNDGAFHIVNVSWKSIGGNVEVWKDGNKSNTSTLNSGSVITAGGCLALAGEQDAVNASYSVGQAHFGDFPEVIIYNTYLNEAQHIIVSNYLAAKYGLSLGANDIYNQDSPGNGNYDNEVAGIGRVDVSNLHNDAQGSGIVRILNPTNLGDDEFLIWGHDNGVAQALSTADLPVGIDTRFELIWRVNETNIASSAVNVGAIDIRFDLTNLGAVTPSDLRLLVDTDNDGLFSDETPISGATSIGNNIYEFASITAIANNVRFTIGTIDKTQTPLVTTTPLHGYTGPGGVGNNTSNVLWVKADEITGIADGNDITTWNDNSGNSNNFSQPDASFKPIYKTNIINGNPVVRFNKTNGRLIKSNFNDFPTNEITEIYVNSNVGESGDGILSYTTTITDNDFLVYGSNNLSIHRPGPQNSGVSMNDGNFHIANISWKGSDGSLAVWKDGSFSYKGVLNSGTSITAGGNLALAGEQDIVNGDYDPSQTHFGDFPEVIIYNKYLNTAQQIIVSNYLSAKYDLTLTSFDMYNKDDVANGNYDFEVAGIGKFNDANLHNDAQGTAVVRILNPRDLDNNEYLIWGHNNLSLGAYGSTDFPAPLEGRWNRVWRVSEVNTSGTAVDVGSIDMRFDLSSQGSVTASDIRLLVDSDNDGIFADETPIAGAKSLGGNIYEFAGVSAIANNLRFTIGTINVTQTPLPIELLYFEAKAIENNKVELNWQTASEIDNDYFVIERSKNTSRWEKLTTIEGANNSTNLIEYTTIDDLPFSGVSYYRLKQVDLNGTVTYSKTRVVAMNTFNTSELNIYPNPTSQSITLIGSQEELEFISVFNLLGQDVTNQITVKRINKNKILIDFLSLEDGMYLVRTKTKSSKVYRK